eukprot:2287575-Alexandrium_andersonii.AAC.1
MQARRRAGMRTWTRARPGTRLTCLGRDGSCTTPRAAPRAYDSELGKLSARDIFCGGNAQGRQMVEAEGVEGQRDAGRAERLRPACGEYGDHRIAAILAAESEFAARAHRGEHARITCSP